MENGKKIALGVTALMLALVGVRVGLIYKANHEEGPAPKPAYSSSTMTDDDAVTIRDRDTLEQVRVPIDTLVGDITARLAAT